MTLQGLTAAMYHLRSSDRSSGSSSNFVLTLTPALTTNRDEHLILHLREAAVPATFYTIITGVNDTVDFNIAAADYAAVLSPGSYSATTLTTELQTQMNAQYAGFTVTYSSLTFKMTVSHAAAFSLIFDSGSNANTRNSVWKVLGFTDGSGNRTDTTVGTTTTGSSTVNTSFPMTFNIRLTVAGQLIHSVRQGNRVVATTFSLPILNSDITILTQERLGQVINTGVSSIHNLSVMVVDDDGYEVSLNGAEWYLLFEC